jgi:hypothetical protein
MKSKRIKNPRVRYKTQVRLMTAFALFIWFAAIMLILVYLVT